MPETSAAPLVIFDCDGVLVDSEPIANRVLAALLSGAGVPTTTEESMRRYTGRSLPEIIDGLEEELGRKLCDDRGDFIEAYRAGVFAGFRDGLRPIDGVAQALARIAPRKCVASSSRPDRIELSLRLTGLLDHFEGRLFSAVEVARGKPQPDLFLHAAQRMGSSPGDCVVVEDSVYGARAGAAAGMRVLGYCSEAAHSDPAALLEAEGARVFGSMQELPGLVSDWLKWRESAG
jgi:HAD superfamily hydrolase (TIGR01509 family)